jgi:hypothetical protein
MTLRAPRLLAFLALCLVAVPVVSFVGCGLDASGTLEGAPEKCLGDGACEDDNPCTTNTCDVETGKCSTERLTLDLPGQTAGDCSKNVCQDGVAATVPDDVDVQDDMEDCTVDQCTDGLPTHAPKANGDPCQIGTADGTCAEGACLVTCSPENPTCPDDGNPCTTDTCDVGTGVCTYEALDGIPTPGIVEQLDCVVHKCVEGLPQTIVDDTELPDDGNDCTDDLCMIGTPSNPPFDVNTACGPNGTYFCDGAGSCGECNTGFEVTQCPFTAPCEVPTCVSQTCGIQFVPNGDTSAPTQTAGDCHIEQCNGAGGQVSLVDDNDTPDDGNDCTTNVCTAGVPSNPLLPANTQCNGTGACNAAGVCKNTLGVACATGGDCGSGNCVDGVCCSTGSCATCLSCNLNGAGTCSNVGNGVDDVGSCSGTSSCDGVGACKLDLGVACVAGSGCLSGNCVDGVCCNTTCTGFCQACSTTKGAAANGTCGNVASGQDVDGECPTATCKTGTCDGNGACGNSALNTNCGSNMSCSGSTQTNQDKCDGAGSCTDNGTTACTPYVCGATACKSSCTLDTDCLGTHYCSANVCVIKLTQGTACLTGNQCGTGNCVDGVCCGSGSCATCLSCNLNGLGTCSNVANGQDDVGSCSGTQSCDGAGVCKGDQGAACGGANPPCLNNTCVDGFCCNTACSGTCQACSNAKTGGANGTCGNVTNATDPDSECANGVACKTGTCNGAGACGNSPLNTTCGSSPSCAAGVQVNQDLCDAAGGCVDNTTTPCTPYICGATACKTSCALDADCVGTHYCSNNVCTLKIAQGGVCATNNQCGTGFCTDGFCCNSACGATCQACSNAKTGGTNGSCGNVTGGQDPDNECAAIACQTGACSGTGATCGFSSSGTLCGSAQGCAAGVQTNQDTCNASGTCVDQGTINCGVYACNGAGLICNTSCAVVGDCASGFVCKPATNTCVQCVTDPDCPMGQACDGATNTCKLDLGQTCSQANQCAGGFCAPEGVCCNTACSGTCQTCAPPGGSAGTCVDVPTGFSDNTCAAPTQACNSGQACDGAFGQACASNNQCASDICGGSSCVSGLLMPCALNADCDAGRTCVTDAAFGAGAKVCKTPAAGACGAANECVSGMCTASVCN